MWPAWWRTWCAARWGREWAVLSAEKIARSHLDRLAVVYLRQSSPRQVRENVRSTEPQYALADRAAQLGWDPQRVLNVDGDLGVSGRDTHRRESYKQLVGRVCQSEVGAIFGLEGREARPEQRRAVAAA